MCAVLPAFRFLERDRFLACCRFVGSIAASVEKADLAGDDFGSVAFAAAVLRLVLAGRQPFMACADPAGITYWDC